MIHRRGLIKSLPQCGREGERASLRRSKKNYRATEVSLLLCDERLERSLFLWVNASQVFTWLVSPVYLRRFFHRLLVHGPRCVQSTPADSPSVSYLHSVESIK